MAAPKCNITDAQKAASDKATVKAVNAAQQTGQATVLSQMAGYSQYQTAQSSAAPPLRKLVTPPPTKVKGKHNLINYYLGEGLVGQQVVDAMASAGYKIKVADVNANIKHYGTDKIPASQPKADLTAAKAKAAAAIKQAEDALKMSQGSPSTASSKDVDAAVGDLAPAPPLLPGEDAIVKQFGALSEAMSQDVINAVHAAGGTKADAVTLVQKKYKQQGISNVQADKFVDEHWPSASSPPPAPVVDDELPTLVQAMETQLGKDWKDWGAGDVKNAAFELGFTEAQAKKVFIESGGTETLWEDLFADSYNQMLALKANVDMTATPIQGFTVAEANKVADDMLKLYGQTPDDIDVVRKLIDEGYASDEIKLVMQQLGVTPTETDSLMQQIINIDNIEDAADTFTVPEAPTVSLDALLYDGYVNTADQLKAFVDKAKSFGHSDDAIKQFFADKKDVLGWESHEVLAALHHAYNTLSYAKQLEKQFVEKYYASAGFTTEEIVGFTAKGVPYRYISDEFAALGTSEAEIVEILTELDFTDTGIQIVLNQVAQKQASNIVQHAAATVNATPTMPTYNTMHGSNVSYNTIQYAEDMAGMGFTEQQVIDQLIKEFPKHAKEGLGFANPVAEGFKKHASKINAPVPAGKPTLAQVVKHNYPDILTAPPAIEVAKLAKQQGFTKQELTDYLYSVGKNSTAISKGLNAYDAAAGMGPSTVAPAVQQTTTGKATIIKSHLDKKHDLIYKLRMAGYKKYEIVNEMAKLGYKIKEADVASNIKWYGTDKIKMSPHVAKQVAVPQVTATGAVKPVSPSTPIAQAENLPPFEKAETVMHKKIAGASGSNPGGLYEDGDGKRWYVKQYSNPLQAKNEMVANAIYRDLGVMTPNSKVIQATNGDLYIATNYIENTGTLKAGFTKAQAEEVLDGFVADVLTANWDAVGLEFDNIITTGGDIGVIRIDQGGSLLFRAKGGLKDKYALKNSIGEWESFFSSTNPAYSKLAQHVGVTSATQIKTIRQQLETLEKAWAKHGNNWRNFLDVRAPQLPLAERRELGEILDLRTQKILAKKAEIELAEKQAKALEELAKTPFNEKDLKFTKLGNVNPAVVQANTPAGAIAFKPGGSYSSEWAVITHAPVPAMATWETMAQWHMKYFPNLSTVEIGNLLSAYNMKYGSKIQGLFPDQYKLKKWAIKTSGIGDTPADHRTGFHTEGAAHEKVKGTAKVGAGRLTHDQKYAVQRYTGSSEGINGALRGKNPHHYAVQVGNLDDVMEKSVVPDNFLTWRGVGSGSELTNMSPTQLQALVGARIDDLGFQSWSVKYEVSTRFASGGVILRAHVPRGTRGIYVHGTELTSHQEYEFILSRGTQWTVTKVSHNGNYYIIDVELAAQPRYVRGKMEPVVGPAIQSATEAQQPVAMQPEIDAEGWVVKTKFKATEDLIAQLSGDMEITDLYSIVDQKSWAQQMEVAAKNLGWSKVQWNTVKKHLKAGPH